MDMGKNKIKLSLARAIIQRTNYYGPQVPSATITARERKM